MGSDAPEKEANAPEEEAKNQQSALQELHRHQSLPEPPAPASPESSKTLELAQDPEPVPVPEPAKAPQTAKIPQLAKALEFPKAPELSESTRVRRDREPDSTNPNEKRATARIAVKSKQPGTQKAKGRRSSGSQGGIDASSGSSRRGRGQRKEGRGSGLRLVPLGNLSRPPRPPSNMSDLLRKNYPTHARRLGRQGTAEVRAIILPSGRVGRVRTGQQRDGFGRACRSALKESKWLAPLDEKHRPVAVRIRYICRFTIAD